MHKTAASRRTQGMTDEAWNHKKDRDKSIAGREFAEYI